MLAASAAVVAVVAVVAGCGDSASSAPSHAKNQYADTAKATPAAEKEAPPSDSDQLSSLLADRGAALEQGDVEDFLATSTGAQLARDKRQMAAAKALPLTSVKLAPQGTRLSGDKATLRVDMSYSFDGIDTYYFKTSSMTLKKTPKGWRVAD